MPAAAFGGTSDPTGAVGLVIRGVLLGYLGLAGLCLAAALFAPSSRRTKAVMVMLVLGVFAGFPAYLIGKWKWEKASQRKATEAACATSELKVGALVPEPGFYAGAGALLQVGDANDRNPYAAVAPDFHEIALYLLKRRMSYLELPKPSTRDRLLGKLDRNDIAGLEHPYLRISIAEAGAPECAASDKWLSGDSTGRTLIAFRKLGLSPDQCIALHGVSELQSRYRISVGREPVVVDRYQSGLWALRFEVRDAVTSSVAATFRLITYEYSDRLLIRCDKVAEARRFEQIVPISPDPRIVPLRTVVDKEPVDFPLEARATRNDIKRAGKFVGLVTVHPSELVSRDGTIWFEKLAGPDDGYSLTLAVNGKLRSTRVRIAGSNMTEFNGLQVTKEFIRLVARRGPNTPYWLAEYSREGAPLRALELTDEQLIALAQVKQE